jgi:FkbM family methyltransferase
MGITEVTYLDVGAHHPFNISNTALFHERGGRGINIEANPILFEAFPKARPNDVNLNVGVGPKAGALTFYMIDDWSGRNTFDKGTMDAFLKENPQFKLQRTIDIPVRPLDELLAEHAADVESIDFMSMDIEGMDTSVICAADLSRFRPKIICIETNSDASRQHLEAKEYELLLRIGGDNVYVAREHLGRVR